MEQAPGTLVSFTTRHLPAELKEVLKEYIHGNDLGSFELTGKVLSRLPKAARGCKVAVDTIVRDANLSTKALTPLKDDRHPCTCPRQHIDRVESDEESEFELGILRATRASWTRFTTQHLEGSLVHSQRAQGPPRRPMLAHQIGKE
jgi:hypothetical protein